MKVVKVFKLISGFFLLGVSLVIFPSGTEAQDQSIKIEVMASRAHWDQLTPGHAFMCISIPLSSGIKEDCYGFYPDGVTGYIWGSGIIRSEPQHRPRRFSDIRVSYKASISETQRRQVIRLINDWNDKRYSLTNQNCIDFVHNLAVMLGWRVPDRSKYQFPEPYVRELLDINYNEVYTGTAPSASTRFGSGACNGCNYETTLSNIRMRAKLTGDKRRVMNSQVHCQAVERVLDCSRVPYPPHEQEYTLRRADINDSNVIITYDAKGKNMPRCSLTFRGRISGNSISGTLTWQRMDGAPAPCQYQIATQVTMSRS